MSLLHPGHKDRPAQQQDGSQRTILTVSGTTNANPEDVKREGLRQLHTVVHELHELLPDSVKQHAAGTPQMPGSCATITQIVTVMPPAGSGSSKAATEQISQSLVCLEQLAAGLEAAAADQTSGSSQAAAGEATETSGKTGQVPCCPVSLSCLQP